MTAMQVLQPPVALGQLSETAQSVAQALEARIKNGDLEVPMLPEVAGKVVSLTNDPDSDAAPLANLVQGDQSLASQVMRIANSAAYCPGATLVSLQQASARLGMGLIGDIALAASINTKMFHAPGYEEHIAAVWGKALLTALWGKEIARTCRRNVEATFLCGLLHSIGRPVLLQTVIEICDEQSVTLPREEILALEDLYYKQVGASVVATWEMPAIVSAAIEYFDVYENAGDARDHTAMVNASVQLASHQMDETSLPQEELLVLGVFGDLNLYRDDVEELLAKQENILIAKQSMTA